MLVIFLIAAFSLSVICIIDLQVTVWRLQDEIEKQKLKHKTDLKDVYKEAYVARLSTKLVKADEQ